MLTWCPRSERNLRKESPPIGDFFPLLCECSPKSTALATSIWTFIVFPSFASYRAAQGSLLLFGTVGPYLLCIDKPFLQFFGMCNHLRAFLFQFCPLAHVVFCCRLAQLEKRQTREICAEAATIVYLSYMVTTIEDKLP